jgi:hypothetical protein
MWVVELSGDQADIDELRKLTPHCECEVSPGHDGRQYLSGQKFEGLSSADEVCATAIKVLRLLNGIARINWNQFQPVQFVGVSQMQPDGTKAVFVYVHDEMRARDTVDAAFVRADGTVEEGIAPETGVQQRAQRIITDPKLYDIVETIAGEITWQRLRVAFEKICAVISGRAAKAAWDNALVKNGVRNAG